MGLRAPGSRRDVGVVAWVAAHVAGRVAGTGPLDLFLVLGRHRRPSRAGAFPGRLMPSGRLSCRDSELVILRAAHLRRRTYELAHHTRLGVRAGLTRAEIARVVGASARSGCCVRGYALRHNAGATGGSQPAWAVCPCRHTYSRPP